MAFLGLVLGSMYEPAEVVDEGRCIMHPKKPRAYVRTECLDYAADMNVALAYYKCLDDWNDDRNVAGRASVALLEAPFRGVRERNPRACAAIERAMQGIGELERAAAGKGEPSEELRQEAANPDAAANLFGLLLGEVFVWREDFWADDLRKFGARLGKFIYLMDAVVDYEDDAKSGSYNPLVALGASPEDMKEDLEMLASGAAEAFERLPLEQDVHLLRSVLYAGMWQQYLAKEEKKKKKETRRG